MSHSTIARIEEVAPRQYKLVSHAGHEYCYSAVDATCESFLEQEESWRNHVLEGQELLLAWMKDRKGECPGQIYWNYQKKPMLEVKLVHSKYKTLGSEINPFDYKERRGWYVDSNCPYKS